jgi:hypothetical protein
MILILGAEGAMGRRYQAILRYLGKPFRCADVRNPEDLVQEMASQAHGLIIATPTATHTQLIRKYLKYGIPILCEKPITKNVAELKELTMDIRRAGSPFRMMQQYSMLMEPRKIGKTQYNYFKHGSDGLIWDCIQIITLARGDVRLGEDSPIWRCMINGKALDLAHMDAAYIGYVQKWLTEPAQDLGEIVAAHEKTAEFQRKGIYV